MREVAVALVRSNECSLSSGRAGGLLLATELHLHCHDRESRALLNEALKAVVDAISTRPLEPTLWSGLVGLLYALEYLEHRLPGGAGESVTNFVDSTDELLLSFINAAAPGRVHFDLISGLTGIGAYALMRSDTARAVALYQAVETKLSDWASAEVRGGLAWRTTPRQLREPIPESTRQFGHLDYGIAHGQPGVLLLLAAGVEYGLTRDAEESSSLMRAALDHLLASETGVQQGSKYPYFDPQTKQDGSRLAWCYGDLSVAFALKVAGQVLSDSSLEAHATNLALDRLAQSSETFLLKDNALCHGRAGVLLLCKKMGIDSSHAALERIRADFESAFESSTGLHESNDVLDGAGGILMAEVASPAGGRHAWDSALCLGF